MRECSTLFLKGDVIAMGITYRKRIKIGNSTFLNASKSGISISQKLGRITVNSTGTTTINLRKGVTYRTSFKKKKK